MGAKELLSQHQLSAAITELNQDIKKQPTDARLRTFFLNCSASLVTMSELNVSWTSSDIKMRKSVLEWESIKASCVRRPRVGDFLPKE